MSKTILIIEDEKTIVDILVFNLRKEGYSTIEAYDGETGMTLCKTRDPDLILLDVMLPKTNGFEVCRLLREMGYTTPIIMLTAREDEADKVYGLEHGADDYITKPFSMRELMARVKANMRRTALDIAPGQSGESDTLRVGRLTISKSNYAAYKDGRLLELTQKEYDLLSLLAQNPGRLFTREELIEKVWNYEYFGDMRTVDVTIRRLREKVEDKPGEPKYIITRRGAGYLLSDKPD